MRCGDDGIYNIHLGHIGGWVGVGEGVGGDGRFDDGDLSVDL